jgi:hypothetical protein
MSWDADYQEYMRLRTLSSWKRWRSVKADASSDYLCSGLPLVYHSFLHSVLSLAPETVPDYDGYVKMFSRLFE